MTKTGKADLMKCASNIHLELVACDIHHADKYWIIVGQKVRDRSLFISWGEGGGGAGQF